MRGIIRLFGELNCDCWLQFLRTRYSVRKDLNIDSSRVHRSNPFLVEIVDARGHALRWVTGESTQFLPFFIDLLNRIIFVGLSNRRYLVMLFKGDDLHNLILLGEVRVGEPFAMFQRTSTLFTEACPVPGSSVTGSSQFKRVVKWRIFSLSVACRISDVKAGKKIDVAREHDPPRVSTERLTDGKDSAS